MKALSFDFFLCSCHQQGMLVVDKVIIFQIFEFLILKLSYSLFDLIITKMFQHADKTTTKQFI